MNQIDYLVIGIYFVGLLAVGFSFSRKSGASASQMFMAGRQSPWWLSGVSAFMTMFSAGTFVVWGGIAYEYGLVAVTINAGYGVAAFVVGRFMAGRWNRSGVSTGAEFIRLRFGGKAFHFYTWFQIGFSFTMGLALYGVATIMAPLVAIPGSWFLCDPATIDAATGLGQPSVPWLCAIFGVVILAYTTTGGLWAVLLTDTLQFFVLAIVAILVVPMSLAYIGGFDTFVTSAPKGFFHPTAGEFGWIFLIGWTIVNGFQLGAKWEYIQRYSCVPTPRDARKAIYLFGILYLVFALIFMAPPMFFRTVTPDADPERAYILMCERVLPAGMLGMMIAALFSATASMISSTVNIFASVLTNDLYLTKFRPNASRRETALVGRGFTVLVGIYMIAGAILIPMLTSYRNWLIVFNSVLLPAVLVPTIWGLFSRRVNGKAVWLCLLAAALSGGLLKFGLAQGGIFSGIGLLQPLVELVQANSRIADLIVGNLSVLLVLVVLELRGRGLDEGWKRTADAAARMAGDGEISPAAARGPVMVMVVALSFLAALIGVIALLASSQKLVLGVSALSLGVIALFFHRVAARMRPAAGPGSTNGS